jgi:two-component system, OmpR family, phosphate regulon sensor histidine kinase PhoR
MPKRRMMWHVLPWVALLVTGAALVFGWTALVLLESSFLAATRDSLRTTADFLDGQLGPEIPEDRQEFARLARRFDEARGARITLLMPDGKVDSDSRGRPEEFEGQLGRGEIRDAIAGGTHDAIRYNAGLDQRVMYLAMPVMRHDRLFALLYLSAPLDRLDRTVSRLQTWMLVITGLLLALCVPLAWRMTRPIAESLERLRAAAKGLSEGHWASRAPIPDPRESAEAAEAFNLMAERVQKRIGVLIQHNNEQKAVLTSMAEGVLAVDSQERIISINEASGRLLGLEQAQAQGRRLQEVVRNADLSRFVSRALANQAAIEADVLLHGDKERVMQAHGSALHDLEGRPIGAVIVLNDVTDFRKLELIRRDFVANVSHELKTPVTSIKGFVETLLDGAMRDPLDSDRFLRIIAKQADRLHAIIEDLLALSKIEQAEESEDLALETTPLKQVLDSALTTCLPGARDRQIDVKLECDPAVTARLNPLLLEQAVVNLLDNAIKYSEPGREVQLKGALSDGGVTISVVDAGSGIADEHLSRIFERFYRVDRARSRKLGGTGLGLAIVKHIVQAHRGRVTVESTLGVGSTFTIHLPKQP